MLIKVEEMHCEKCVARIEKALAEDKIPCKVSLAEKTVEVPDDLEKKARELLEDLGF